MTGNFAKEGCDNILQTWCEELGRFSLLFFKCGQEHRLESSEFLCMSNWQNGSRTKMKITDLFLGGTSELSRNFIMLNVYLIFIISMMSGQDDFSFLGSTTNTFASWEDLDHRSLKWYYIVMNSFLCCISYNGRRRPFDEQVAVITLKPWNPWWATHLCLHNCKKKGSFVLKKKKKKKTRWIQGCWPSIKMEELKTKQVDHTYGNCSGLPEYVCISLF